MRPVNVQGSLASNVVAEQPFYWSENAMPMFGAGGPVVLQKNDPFVEFPAHPSGYGDFEDDEHEDTESMQICNLNESVLRLEEMAQEKEVTFRLSKDGENGLHDLYQELLELNSRTNPPQHSFKTSCRFTAARRYSGLMSEDVDLLDERKLIQLVYEFGLEKVEELPVLQMEALNNYI